MITPALTRKTRTIYALSVGGFLLTQVVAYLLGAILALSLLPDLLLRLNAAPIAYIVIAPITMAVVITFRELITQGLWRQIGHVLQTPPMELDLILR